MKKVTKITTNLNLGFLKVIKNVTKIFTKEESEKSSSSDSDNGGGDSEEDRETKKSKYSLVKFILLIIFIGYLVSFHGFRSISEIFEGYGFLVYVAIGVILILGFGAFYSLRGALASRKKEIKPQKKEEDATKETKKIVVSKPGFSWWSFIKTALWIIAILLIANKALTVYGLKKSEGSNLHNSGNSKHLYRAGDEIPIDNTGYLYSRTSGFTYWEATADHIIYRTPNGDSYFYGPNGWESERPGEGEVLIPPRTLDFMLYPNTKRGSTKAVLHIVDITKQ